MPLSRLFLCCVLLLVVQTGFAQEQRTNRYALLQPADSLHATRFWLCAGGGALIYSGFAYGLYNTWYRDFDLVRFHTFDDSGEWQQMDKMGHLLTAYTETRLVYGGARWTGLSPGKSRFAAAAIGTFLQATIEVMDGFSSNWGFSWSDIGFNTLGVATFVVQDAVWSEQRIVYKVSNELSPYPTDVISASNGEGTTSLINRNQELYGRSLPERFLKDYNDMTVWASVNMRSFYPNSTWPSYLNVAVGMGAGNLYGAYVNSWNDGQGNNFRLPRDAYPRHRQFFVSPDIDLTRIRTNKRWLKTTLSILNFIKIPAPAVEYNTLGYWKWHWLYL